MNYILIIANILLVEILLSIDNASVLSLMVKHLPKDQQSKALKYWILWAYFFRWLCLVLVSYLLKFTFLKLLWGLYLIYLTYDFFKDKWIEKEIEKESKKLSFWKTVIMIEIIDLTFSLDNIFAVVAMTPNIYLIITWVFIWILAMRFIANIFIQLMDKYPWLEKAAFIVIWFLGFKLCLSYLITFSSNLHLIEMVNWHISDLLSSIITITIFLFPIIKKYARIKFKQI